MSYRLVVFWICAAVFRVEATSLIDPPGTISGDCSSGFSCSGGDPVLCSIAVAESVVGCQLKMTGTTIADIKQNVGITKTLADVPNENLEVTLGTIPGRSGACPAPVTYTVMGTSFHIDTAPVCDLAKIIGWFMLLASVVVGAKILAGGE